MKKKKKTKKSKRSGLTRWWVWFILLLLLIVGGLLLYEHFKLITPSPTEGLDLPGKEQKATPWPKKDTGSKTTSSTQVQLPERIQDLEIPAPEKRKETRALKYQNYQVLYSTSQRIPLWVAYELTYDEARGKLKRSNNFRPDPRLESQSSTNADYTRSGYDRGHLAPAADMAFSQTAMSECFYFTNIAPQNQSLNRGSWKELEEAVRSWTLRGNTVYITTGTVAPDHSAVIGKNRVAVPDYFYKAVLSLSDHKAKGIGFVFRNQSATDSPFHYAVSIDSVESLTGFDLFPLLPDSIEERVERSFDINEWR